MSPNCESAESIPFISKRPALPRGTITSLRRENAADPDPTMTMGATRVGAGETAATRFLLRANHGAGWPMRQEPVVGHLVDDGRIVNILITARTQNAHGMHRMERSPAPARVVDATVSFEECMVTFTGRTG